MGRLSHQSRVANLRGLQYLAADRAVFVANEERTTTGFARVLHYAAYTDRTIQFCALFGRQVRVLQGLEHTFLLGHEYTGKNLLVADGIFLQTVRHHIVDIFDEYDIGILLIEVLDERSVSARTEEQLAFFRAERRTIGVSRDSVCGRELLREGHIVFDAEFLFELSHVVSYMLAEQRQMVMAHREMEIDGRLLAVLGRSYAVLRSLYKVLQRGRTRTVAVFMEEEQTLRKLTVLHIFEQVPNGFLSFLARQLGTESKAVFMRQKILNERRLDTILQILEQILEHTTGSTGSGYELQYFVSLLEVTLPCSDILLLLCFLRSQDPIFRRSGRHDV